MKKNNKAPRKKYSKPQDKVEKLELAAFATV